MFTQTYTGRKFFPLNPNPDDVCIEDIAHALSQKCRFNGHTKQFYSVAEHSVHVANRCRGITTESGMAGLLHDAAEAYLPDVAAPIKEAFVISPAIRNEEDQLMGWPKRFSTFEEFILRPTIFHGLGVRIPSGQAWADVHVVDKRMCATERVHLMAKVDWDWQFPWQPYDDMTVAELTQFSYKDHGKTAFMRMFEELSERLKKAA